MQVSGIQLACYYYFSERVQRGGPGKIGEAFREKTVVKLQEGKIQLCGRLAETKRTPDSVELQPRCWADESLKVTAQAAQATAAPAVARLYWVITWWLHCHWGIMGVIPEAFLSSSSPEGIHYFFLFYRIFHTLSYCMEAAGKWKGTEKPEIGSCFVCSLICWVQVTSPRSSYP